MYFFDITSDLIDFNGSVSDIYCNLMFIDFDCQYER